MLEAMMTGMNFPKFPAAARVAWVLALVPFLGPPGAAGDKKPNREQGELAITLAGREIGSESYVLITSADSVQSTSTLSFRSPQDTQLKISIETRLSMDARFKPLSYELTSDAGGKKGTMVGRFSPNQVIFEYGGSANSSRRGLLVGDQYTILDTNVFHHFIFLTRLFIEKGGGKTERFEVVIPQEDESGVLRMSELEKEMLPIGGKKIRCRRFRVDSGALQIDLWTDERGVLQKVAVPARQIEVIRKR
jgi:hypothetical protein